MNITVNQYSKTEQSSPFDILKDTIAHTHKSVDNIWNYLGKTIQLSRHGMNAIVNNSIWKELGRKSADIRIKDAIIRLKLFSIVNVPLNIPSIISQVNKLWSSIQWHDNEGILLSTLAITVLAGDIFDAITTFVNALLQTLSHVPIVWISIMGIPLGLSLLGINTVSRCVKLYHLSKFLTELNKELIDKMENNELVPEELQSALTKFLESKLGANLDKNSLANELRSQIKQCNEAILERHTNSKTVKLLESLKQLIQPNQGFTEANTTAILGILKEIKSSIHQELGLQTSFLFAYALSATGLVMLLMAAPVTLPFIILGSSVLLRLAVQIYQDFKQDNKVEVLPFHTLYFKERNHKLANSYKMDEIQSCSRS